MIISLLNKIKEENIKNKIKLTKSKWKIRNWEKIRETSLKRNEVIEMDEMWNTHNTRNVLLGIDTDEFCY